MKLHLKSAAIGGSVAAVAVAGALIAGPVLADDSSTTPGISSGTEARGFAGHGMRGGPGGPMLHSEGVVAQSDTSGNTTYVTVRMQSGTITAASDTAITVKSDDGYTRTWTIASTTVVLKDGSAVKGSAFAVGDTVVAHGSVDGDTVTTTFIGSGQGRGMDDGMRGGMGGHGRGGHMDGDGPMGDANGAPSGTLAPVPSASASSTSA